MTNAGFMFLGFQIGKVNSGGCALCGSTIAVKWAQKLPPKILMFPYNEGTVFSRRFAEDTR